LDVDERLGALSTGTPTLGLALQLGDALVTVIALRRWSTFLAGQSGHAVKVQLLPPRGEVGRVQALAAQHRAEVAELRAGCGLVENLALVLGGEPTAG